MKRLAGLTAVAIVLGLMAQCTSQPSTSSQPTGASSAPAPSYSQPGGLLAIHDPGNVTGTLAPGACRANGQLPDPRCTPGSTDPYVNQGDIQTTICVPGYTKTVRPPSSQTDRFKYRIAYPAYGIAFSTRTELDHLVSLELGGSNDASNLWPEQPPTPNAKDKVENALHAAVCSGKVTLQAAQQAIARNWVTAEKVLGIG